jgi:hypothetical protein
VPALRRRARREMPGAYKKGEIVLHVRNIEARA